MADAFAALTLLLYVHVLIVCCSHPPSVTAAAEEEETDAGLESIEEEDELESE